MITERLNKPVLIQDLHYSHPDLRWQPPIQAVDGGVLAVYRDSDYRYNVIKIDQEGKIERDQEGKIINKLYVTDKKYKHITGFIWEEPDLYVLCDEGDAELSVYIEHVREGNMVKQHHMGGFLYGGAVDNDDILIVSHFGGSVISYNVQTGQKDIKLQGLKSPRSITKTVYENQVLYLIAEQGGDHCVSVYNSSWIKQKTIGSR